ncbi:MAG: hypothetical protein Tsb002_05350 [Wenzhouxiangellaceae bacterium]
MKTFKAELKAGRFTVPYRVYGTSGPLMVCVSGAQQSMTVWKSFVKFFHQRFRIMTMDLPGQGRARIDSGSASVSLDEQVEILHQLLEENGAWGEEQSVMLCGASWGGIVIAAFAAKYPKIADKIILGSFGMKPSSYMLEVINHGRRLFHAGKSNKIGDLIVECFGDSVSPLYKKAIRQQFNKMDRDKLMTFYAHCDFVEEAGNIHDFIMLRNIEARTLIINGQRDTILDLEDLDLATQHIPNCECRVVENVGHFLHFEDSSILGIYDQFLAS